MRPKGRLPAEHKFQAGQKVTLAANFMNRSAAGGGYVVTKQLPERNGEFEYRIKKISELHERVAREGELARE
jgi:hypothetical protein